MASGYERVIAGRRSAGSLAHVSSAYPPFDPATLVLERLPDAPHEPESVCDAPLVGFDAFLRDARAYGWVRLSADRLTDLLNAHAQVTLVNVELERLADGRLGWHERLPVERDRLLAVRSGGPRGDPARRRHLRLHPLVVQTGPYLIGGYLHAQPGVAPLEELRTRPAVVPLSDGWLELWSDGRRRQQWVGTILFNRLLADAIELVRDEDLEYGMTGYPLRPRTDHPVRAGSPDGEAERDGAEHGGP